MTEQVDEVQNIPLTSERLLAAILETLGSVEVRIEDLLQDFSERQLSVEQTSDDAVTFKLIKAIVVDGEVIPLDEEVEDDVDA